MHRTDLALHECALYKVRSPRHLADILLTDFDSLDTLAHRGSRNYREYPQEMGGDKPPRWIECPCESLMRLQKRIRRLLAQILPPDFLHSGVSGRSPVTNARQHCNHAELSVPAIKLDIAKFFPSSDGRRVYWFFYKTMRCSSDVSTLLCNVTTAPAGTVSDHLHLPTGAATSQALAYCCYREMFERLAKLAADNNVVLGVFVDDIVFSGPKATRCLLNEARLIIQHFELRSKRLKERAWRASEPKLVTGVVLTKAGVRLPNSRRLNVHQLQQSLHRASALEDRVTLARRLLGALFSAGQIEERYTAQGHTLLRKLRGDPTLWEAMRCRLKPDKFSHTQLNRLAESIYNTGSAENVPF